jgi:hypothetical protein
MPFHPERRTFLKAAGALLPYHWLRSGVTIPGAAVLLQVASVPVSLSGVVTNPVTTDSNLVTVDSTLINIGGQSSPFSDGGPLAFSGVSPNVLAPGGTVQLTISGSGFEAGSTVQVCRNGLSVNNVSILNSDTILAEVNIPANQAEGLCGIRIDNPDGERVIARDVITISAG